MTTNFIRDINGVLKYHCGCGSIISLTSIHRHIQSIYHLEWENRNIEEEDDITTLDSYSDDVVSEENNNDDSQQSIIVINNNGINIIVKKNYIKISFN
jgi:hypothetical protein